MKESIGGTWLLGLVVVFIVLFASFIAVAINYTKAFRVKNEIINIIERDEGFITEKDANGGQTTEEKISDYLDRIGYNRGDLNIGCPKEIYGDDAKTGDGNNYCYKLITTSEYSPGSVKQGYYKLSSFVIIDLHMLFDGSFTVPVSGETKLLHNIPSTASEGT